MKEIDKLGKIANDTWLKSDDCGLCGDEFYSVAHDSEFIAGFIAGFRKAIEMALECVLNGENIPNEHYTRDIEANIKALGESEVKE